jgi:hypothetical protein
MDELLCSAISSIVYKTEHSQWLPVDRGLREIFTLDRNQMDWRITEYLRFEAKVCFAQYTNRLFASPMTIIRVQYNMCIDMVNSIEPKLN